MIFLIAVFTSSLNCVGPRHPAATVNITMQVSAETTRVGSSSNRSERTPVDPNDLITFAQTLKGVRYKYASADPDKGFDCSGFVQYVFKHFHVNVPRSSSAFSKIGKKVPLDEARPGDIILFTGTNNSVRVVGHVGIVTGVGSTISFIHATSGKAYSVIETAMTPHYRKRFVKVVRVLE